MEAGGTILGAHGMLRMVSVPSVTEKNLYAEGIKSLRDKKKGRLWVIGEKYPEIKGCSAST